MIIPRRRRNIPERKKILAMFVIADTHLSGGTDKPMTVFGSRWAGWTERLTENWTNTVKDTDTVIIPGDISWAMTLDEALPDFKLLDSLPGTKIIGKGNHDYWWNTVKKNEDFFAANGITTVKHLYNNSYEIEDMIVCGCRGWYYDEKNAPDNADYDKIAAREAGRLERSLKSAETLDPDKKRVVFFHFPPVFGAFVCRELIDIMHRYGVTECCYGHIHGKYDIPPEEEFEGITLRIVSADYLGFRPLGIN